MLLFARKVSLPYISSIEIETIEIMKTKSQIFKEAHIIAKSFEGDYKACFTEALRISHKNAKENFTPDFVKIEMTELNKIDVKGVFDILRWTVNSEALVDDILTVVSKKSKGFQSDIAKKALMGANLSEKQTWCVAYEYQKLA